MPHHYSFSHTHLSASPTHQLTPDQLAAHPDTLGRILYFALPFAFTLIVHLALHARNQRVHQNNFIRTLPSSSYSTLALIISLIGAATIGIYAILADAWTVLEWILFVHLCVLPALKSLIYTADTHITLFIATILAILITLPGNWLFAVLTDMSEASQSDIAWKHASRNVVGFLEGCFLIYAVEYLCETLVHIFKLSSKGVSYFFWVFAPLLVAGILVLNILKYGPFLDQIGLIAAAILLFLGAAVNTLFHREEEIVKK